MNKEKCSYCGKHCTPHSISVSAHEAGTIFCSDSCRRNYESSISRDTLRSRYMIFGIIIGFIVMFYGIATQSYRFLGGGIAVMGAFITLLPCATPETVRLLGYRRAKAFARILGIVLILAGIWIGFA
ncbi:MAG TPA: DUF2116 family Zn-ribbon domain-containing protein [Candidatus Mediterraneibacter cottocaccae]|nr:DUF2116 family Zn-ribbon domain-containing protein [Candidatus Mediterraneibacter cottocaccae]